MATLPAFLRKMDAPAKATAKPVALRAERDQYQLRALPQEDVFFYCKKIDNSRLVREADPKANGACWSVIGAAALIVAMLTGALVPSVANTLAGYKLEALRAEERRLIDERRAVD